MRSKQAQISKNTGRAIFYAGESPDNASKREVGWFNTRLNQAGKSLKKLIYAVILLDRLILTNKTSPLLRLELYPTKRRKERKL